MDAEEKHIKTKVELLAPARDLECGMAAIHYGADAVYVGAPKFSARKAVGLSLKDIEILINEAHKYWGRVYVALNTILYDEEFDEAHSIIRSVYSMGADGLIIQDLGLLELDLPPIPLIASTQIHNYNVAHIQFLEQVGFQRVILARELSLEDIKKIRNKTSLELETFIHGALCVSFSGRCYVSYGTQHRSANRGECAQPCRLPYSLSTLDGKTIAENEYLLSLKDLNLSRHLSDLLSAGVTSFKIEGRLKDISYVKNVTAFYRQQLDAILSSDKHFEKSSSGKIFFTFNPEPSKTFNRGFTTYFLYGRQKDILSRFTPKSIGACVGKVKEVRGNYVRIDSKEQFRPGDGLCFFDSENKLCGTRVEKVEGSNLILAESNGITIGTELFRNYDAAFDRELNHNTTKRKIPVTVDFNELPSAFELIAVDEDGNTARIERALTHSPAKNKELAMRTLQTQLSKSGGTIFDVKKVKLNIAVPYLFTIKELNNIRRDVLQQLERERTARFPKKVVQRKENPLAAFLEKALNYSYNVSNSYVEQFYKRFGVEKIEKAFELTDDHNGKVVMTTKHCLRFYFDLCNGKKGKNEPLVLTGRGFRYLLSFQCNDCVMKVILDEKKDKRMCTRGESNPQPTAS